MKLKESEILPGKDRWQKVKFKKPLRRELYRLADGVSAKKVRVLHSQEKELEKIYWSLGQRGGPIESITLFVEGLNACDIVNESLSEHIDKVERIDPPKQLF